ncbi:endonuclease V, partial [Streptomyces sp. NPDC059096]|uniref:endonuclease V n=1 Tax=Streptomyces sp. NPDC059096 TaxID=3346727 RepID=UPI0036CF0CA1
RPSGLPTTPPLCPPPRPPPGPPPTPTPPPAAAAPLGRALRTRAGVKPVFVSVGHRVDLATACAHTLRLAPDYRLPETTRRADALCREALREALARGAAGGTGDPKI